MSTRHDPLSPDNRLYRTILVETVDSSTGAATPIVSGSVTAFLATSADPDAVTADANFAVNATHVGVASPSETTPYPLGTWLLIVGPHSATLLDTYFTTQAPPYLIVVRTGEARVYEKLHYKRSKAVALG